MSSTYAGNPATFPTPVQIPSPKDMATAASVNAAIEALADQTAWLKAKNPTFSFVTKGSQQDNATTSYVEIMHCDFPAGPGTYKIGVILRAKVTAPGLSGTGRVRTSSAFGTAGTSYTELSFTVNHPDNYAKNFGFGGTLVTTTVTGTHLYLETKMDTDPAGTGTFQCFAGSHIWVMAVN